MDDQDDHPDGSEPTPSPTATKSRRNNNRSKTSTAGGPVRQKGKRGPSRTSCAECRRLKLKCDGTIPCAQCVKRGYGSICPDGTHLTGQGHRLFWNNTAELRNKISEFGERIRQLEEALKSAHSVVSHEEHPLLSEDHLQIKEGISLPADVRPRNPPSGIPMSTEEEESKPDIAALDRFGSLSISQSGGSRFFGHAASAWWFMHNEEPEEFEDDSAVYPLHQLLPLEILAQTGTYPLSLVSPPYLYNEEDHLQTLIESVPPEDEAKELVGCAFRYAFFIHRPISYEQYLSTVHEHVYLLHPTSEGLDIHASGLFSARLAVLFMLLAIGTHVSRETGQFEPDAEKYHQLGRASLMCSRLVEDPSIEGIQALFLTSLYLNLRGTAASDNSNMRWLLGGLVTKLSQEMGLHIDPSRYGISEMESQRRRLLFREIFIYDLGQAFVFCRPPAISSGYCDIQSPADMVAATESDFHVWKYKLTSECLSSIHAQAYAAAPPNHATVLALTRRVEQYPIWTPSNEGQHDTENNHAERVLQQHFSRITMQEILLYLHRPFFAIATDKFKDDPLACEYGISVIAAYRSAHQIVSLMHYMHTHAEHPSNRIWFIWANLFGSAVILGGLVVRCPHLSFAKDAYDQLRLACDLFSRVKDAFNANKVYDKMVKARDLAHKALHDFATRDQADRGSTPPISPTEDLLTKFGGKTRTISRPEVNSNGSGSGSTGGSAGAGSPMGSRGGSAPAELPLGPQLVVPLPLSETNGVGYHPTVVAYLKTLPPSTHVHGFETSKVPAWGTPPPVSTPLSARSRSHTLPPILEGESSAHSPEASASYGGQQRMDVSMDPHPSGRPTVASPVSATYSNSSGLHQRSHTVPYPTNQAASTYGFSTSSVAAVSAIPTHLSQQGHAGGYPYSPTGHQPPPTSPYGTQPGWPAGTPTNRGPPLLHDLRDGAQRGTVPNEPWNQLMSQMTGSQ